MRRVTYSMSMSLDGFVAGPDGSFDWSVPDDDVFALAMAEIRGVGVHLLGRRLYEAMLFWDDVDPGTLSEAEREWAALWQALPKVVFSRTLTEVRGASTRLATGTVAEEIARWRADPGDGEIAIGGAGLAAAVAAAGLVDEYRIQVYPVLVGGGTPLSARDEQRVDLELLEHRDFGAVRYVRYGVVRPPG